MSIMELPGKKLKESCLKCRLWTLHFFTKIYRHKL